MCLQNTKIIFSQADNDNNFNYYPIFHTNHTRTDDFPSTGTRTYNRPTHA